MPSLRLHRDSVDPDEIATDGEARTLKFPTDEASRRRLVAGTVALSPLDEDAERPCLRLECSADGRGSTEDAPSAESLRPPQIIRQIENTLENMQRRLDEFRREVDDSLKFPDLHARDGDLPPAA